MSPLSGEQKDKPKKLIKDLSDASMARKRPRECAERIRIREHTKEEADAARRSRSKVASWSLKTKQNDDG